VGRTRSAGPGRGPGAPVGRLVPEKLYPWLDGGVAPPAWTGTSPPGEAARSRRRWALAAVVAAAFAAGFLVNALVFGVGHRSRAAGVVIGQGVVKPTPPATARSGTQAGGGGAPALVWSPPYTVDRSYAPQAVSCPTATFCVVVDNHGRVIVEEGGEWGAPADVDGSAVLDSVSCPTTSFCMAVDQAGDAVSYNGSAWSRPQRIDNTTLGELTTVSCASPAFCAAADAGGNALVFDGRGWSAPQQVDPAGWTAGSRDSPSLSCPAPGFCAGVDPVDNVFYYLNGAWQASASLDPSRAASPIRYRNEISCFSSSFCAATDNLGEMLTYDRTGWSAPVEVDPTDNLEAVSCPAPGFCAAVDGLLPVGFEGGDGTGQVVVYDGTAWSTPRSVDPGGIVDSLSCAGSGFCVAVDQEGRAVVGTAPAHLGHQTASP
jgi:hypothetical protein